MNILQFITAKEPGGIEQVAFDYANCLQSVNSNMFTISNFKDYLAQRYEKNNLHIDYDPGINKWWQCFNYISVAKWRKYIEQNKIRCIVVHNGRVQKYAALIANNKIPTIGVCHTDNIKRRLLADSIFTVNTAIRTTVKQNLDQNKQNKIAISIPNPLSVNKSEIIKEIDINCSWSISNLPTIGVLGKFEKHKNMGIILKALNELKKNGFEYNAIFGGDGPERKNLVKLSYDLGIGNQVKFIGWVTDKRQFFSSVDLFILPSLVEPFGLVLTEAICFGKPVISSRTAGPSDIIENENMGMFFSAKNYKELASAIKKLSENPEFAGNMARNALNVVTKTYSTENIGDKLLTAFDEVCTAFHRN